jgi:hypothetical protein
VKPVLFVWDEDKQEYAPATGPVCTARWASGGYSHAAGDICGEEPWRQVGDVWLCSHHYVRAQDWVWDAAREQHLTNEREREALDEERKQWERVLANREQKRQAAAIQRRVQQREATSLVYYIRRTSDGMIKIGFTSDIDKRMTDLQREHGELQLLHTAPGARPEEDALHKRFAAWNYQGEWFHPGRVLMRSIKHEREKNRPARVRGTVPLGVLAEVSKGALAKPPPGHYAPPRQRLRYAVVH